MLIKQWIIAFMMVGFVNLNFSQEIQKFSKNKEEMLIQRIKEKYKIINSQKSTYQKEENYWNYESDMLPDEGYVGNEDGNEEMTNTIYMHNAQKRLHEIDQLMYKYQVPYRKKSHYEAYFWNGDMIFIYSRVIESLAGPDYYNLLENITALKEGTRVNEKRIYLHQDTIFRFLQKNIHFTGKKDIDNLLNHSFNTRSNLDSLNTNDYSKEYNLFKDF